MKRSIYNVVWALMILSAPMSAFASATYDVKWTPNRFYVLTPEVAKKLNLDYDQIKKQTMAGDDEDIIFRINEQNELDLSIFDSKAFSVMHADLLSGAK